MTDETRTIAVCGATGRQGGAVARALLQRGWRVRGLTRSPQSVGAKRLAELGAEVVRADMDDVQALRSAFEGVYGVFSVQNGLTSGFDREVAQGRNVAEAARDAGISHVVFASAGTGESGTGIASWDAKSQIERHMDELGLAFTSLRPQAFMELMTDKGYYPAVGTWSIWPRLNGDERPIPWLAVEDVGVIAATVFSDPERFVGRSIRLAGDVRTLGECRSLYREVIGHDPRSLPMPIWLFDRFTRGDVSAIWRWAQTGDVLLDTAPTREIHPTALTIEQWLRKGMGALQEI